ncbi:MAG: hypothetical protein ABII71_02830 [Candidatus Micrarchaeota archaeon]
MAGIKKVLKKHFRIITLLVLSAVIILLSMNLGEANEMLHFRTYMFNLEGSGQLGGVDADFDFQKQRYELTTYLQKGTYYMHGTERFEVLAGGKSYCAEIEEESVCKVVLAAPSEMKVVFDGGRMLPNGNFRFNFFNKTEISLEINLGENYSFEGLYSVLPQGIHGHYAPDDNQVVVQTYGGTNVARSDHVDFALYSIDGVAHRKNQGREWFEDYILVPLVVAFVMLLISDMIDYAHGYVKKR